MWDVDQDMSMANDTIIPVGVKLEAYVNNLSPGKTYHMRVLASSNGGDGRMSSPANTFQMGDYHTASPYRNHASSLNYKVTYSLVIMLGMLLFFNDLTVLL